MVLSDYREPLFSNHYRSNPLALVLIAHDGLNWLLKICFTYFPELSKSCFEKSQVDQRGGLHCCAAVRSPHPRTKLCKSTLTSKKKSISDIIIIISV